MKKFYRNQVQLYSEFFRLLAAPKPPKFIPHFQLRNCIEIIGFTAILLIICIIILFSSLRILDNLIGDKYIFEISKFQTLPIIIHILLSFLIAPIFEEISLRLNLLPSIQNGCIALLGFCIKQLLFSRKAFNNLYFNHTVNLATVDLYFILILGIFLLGYSFLFNASYARFYGSYFYVSAVLFSVLHYRSEIANTSSFFILFLYNLHHFFFGLGMGFLRLKYGLVASIIGHGLNNALVYMLISIF